MARFKPMELIDKMSGKFHSKSKYYAAEKYGTQYTGLVGEITVPPTEKQVTNREKFTTARANMAALIYDRLLSLVPWLDESCIAVTPHLLWHKDTGVLEEVEGEIPVTSPWE